MCEYDNGYKSLVDPTRLNEEEMDANKMVRALSAIALEMQSFHSITPSYQSFGENQDLQEKLSVCKSNLRLKRKQIKLLKQNLRKACIVAKTVVSAKERGTVSLHNYISNARSDCMKHKKINKTETISSLISENQALHEKIKNLDQFIELGYQELEKMRNGCPKKLPTVMQLKEIMMSCGQYYADFYNACDMRLQLEQRIRFLNNKIKILVNNLDGIAEEVKNLRYQNTKLQNENAYLKNKLVKRIENSPLEVMRSTNRLIEENNMQTRLMTDGACDQANIFNFSSHLLLVQDLLSTQDDMLKDLKKLSEKLKIEPEDDKCTDLLLKTLIKQ